MTELNAYFVKHKSLTLGLMWLFFFLALGYALVALLLIPTLNFWLMVIPSLIALYFRIMYSMAAYDPRKDRRSAEYIPYSERPENQKRLKKKKSRK